MEYKIYKKKVTAKVKMRPYKEGEKLERVSISQADIENGSPKLGDMIACNITNEGDLWLVNQKYFKENYEEDENN